MARCGPQTAGMCTQSALGRQSIRTPRRRAHLDMARAWVEDMWFSRDPAGQRVRTQRHGRGLQWRVRWYDDHRRMRARSFRTKREAEQWQTTVDHELREGVYRDRALGQTTFADVAEEWLATRTDITPTSRYTYRGALNRHLLPRWGAVAVARIRRQDIATWFAGFQGRLSPRSVIGIHRVFSMVLGWAMETDRIATNPARGLPLPRPDADRHVFLTHAEVDALANAAEGYRTMILTLAYTGLRFGEAAALRVASVDLDARRLTVSHAWAGGNTGTPYLSTPKNHERRRVGLPLFLVAELAEVIGGRPSEAWLFVSPRGVVLDLPNWNRRVFAPAVRRAGLGDRGLTPHSLRHTAASLAIAAGADVKVVQTMLGHKDAAMTLNVYAGLFPDRLDSIADALDMARQRSMQSRLGSSDGAT